MSASSQSRHHTPSVRAWFMSSNFTDVRPVIIWQTKGQREQHDLSGLTGTGGERSKETKERERGSGDGKERRRRRVSKTRAEYQTTSARGGELLPRYQSWREESQPSRRRGNSCSKIRSFPRGRSRSPRKAGEPGPGILKGRSVTHDGRKREGASLGWKMLRINRVDEVREFSSWPEETMGQGGEERHGEEIQNGVEEDIAARQDLKLQLAQEECGEKFGEIEMADDVKKVDENGCSVQITITPTSRVAKIIKRMKHTKSVVVVGSEKVEKKVLAAREDLAEVSDCGETTAALEHDGNNNDVSEVDVKEDATEESLHGFDPLIERDPQLPVAASYDAFIDQLESEGSSQSGLLKVKFSGVYESRPVQCLYRDCQASSLPSTLGLLPLPRAGHQWLCAAHSQCLLCSDLTSLSNSVRCTICARQYHTSHLDMEEEFKDKLERELYICKLCSDPSQFPQLGGEQGEEAGDEFSSQAVHRASSAHPQHRSSSNLHPSLPTKNTKIKSRPHSTPKVNPKARPVSTSRGKPLQHSDLSLLPGWHRQLVKSSKRRWRVVIIGPDGRRFWSMSDVKRAFSEQRKEGIKWKEFNFSVFGSK